ncbi:hypothetical protein DH2020_035884 [Rehmannia glutinosa]|uniref:SWIM-type domain-containing protein n=1 Tax=Rehmannia glutinosa TaxID=99300 RepID=A0ABR0V8F2_REHGL
MAKRGEFQPSPDYDAIGQNSPFTLKIYHGGIMREYPVRNYSGGQFDFFDRVDGDEFRLIELKALVEGIRKLIMSRLQVNRDKARDWDCTIYPRIKALILKNMKDAGECIPMKSDDWHFDIAGPFDQHNVDMQQKSCSCRRWDLTGIPCRYVISAIWCRNEEPEEYVHDCYKVSTYLSVYENAIMGVNGIELWPKVDLPAPLPPNYENRPGRPKKMRMRQADEPPSHNATKLRRTRKSRNAGRCGVLGHN